MYQETDQFTIGVAETTHQYQHLLCYEILYTNKMLHTAQTLKFTALQQQHTQ